MDTDNKSPKIHPLAAAAAVAVILVCITGVAAMLGILPNFNKNTPPVAINETNTIVAEATTSAPAATPVTEPVANQVAQAPEPAPAVAEKPVQKKVEKKVAKKPVKKAEPTYPQAQYHQAPPYCPNCGVVESVIPIQQEAPTSGIGAGVGAVVGGLLGNQVGGGNGRTIATIAGAVGGGFAGNAIEKNTHTTTGYQVNVRLEDGTRQRFMMQALRFRSGDAVRVENGNIYAR